jgi:hypothetical protein
MLILKVNTEDISVHFRRLDSQILQVLILKAAKSRSPAKTSGARKRASPRKTTGA